MFITRNTSVTVLFLFQRRFCLFTIKDIQSIDRNYFNVLQESCYAVTLQSKNTKHYWHITHQAYSHFSSCIIEHKHHYSDSYHPHRNQKNLKAAMVAIKSHDDFQINVRDKQKKRAHKARALQTPSLT